MLYDVVQSSNRLGIGFCHTFLYMHECEPMICATTACIVATEIASFTLTSGSIMMHMYRTSNY